MREKNLNNLYYYMIEATGDEWYALFNILKSAYENSMKGNQEIWDVDRYILKLLKKLEKVAESNRLLLHRD